METAQRSGAVRDAGGDAHADTDDGVEPQAPDTGQDAVNEVRLCGRVLTAPELRELPSGTSIVTVRVSVPRSATPTTKGSKQASDWVDCTAWGARQRRQAAGWRTGDLVEVRGSLRRRVYRGARGTAMRLEVEVLGGRMVRRARPRPVA